MKYSKHPKIDRKTGQQNGWRWEFRVYDQELQHNRKVPVDQIPEHIRNSQDEKEVDEWCRLQDAAVQSRRFRLEQALAWRTKYHDKDKLLEMFTEKLKKIAPKSWRTSICHLENYVFHFFLDIKQLNNMNDWELYFEEFVDWLGKVKPMKGVQPHLALNTQNNIITANNQFLAFMEEKHQIARFKKCPAHPDELLPKVSAEDLIEDHELPVVQAALLEIREVSSKMYRVGHQTGLRSMELKGLCLPFITQGNMLDGPKTEKIHRALEERGLGNYHGYICLESQAAIDAVRVAKSYYDVDLKRHLVAGTVPRVPLKCRKDISPKWYRYIPIYDKETWNILVEACEVASALYEKRIYGNDPRDYLLFDGITSSSFYADVVKAFEKTGLRYRCPHKLRHTFLTWFYDKIGEDSFLAEKVGGHRDKKSIEIYSHIREQIGRERVFAQQKMKPLSRVS